MIPSLVVVWSNKDTWHGIKLNFIVKFGAFNYQFFILQKLGKRRYIQVQEVSWLDHRTLIILLQHFTYEPVCPCQPKRYLYNHLSYYSSEVLTNMSTSRYNNDILLSVMHGRVTWGRPPGSSESQQKMPTKGSVLSAPWEGVATQHNSDLEWSSK